MRLLTTLGLAAAISMAFAAPAFAVPGELDNEALVTNEQIQAARELPATVVVRVNEATKQVEVLHSAQAISADAASHAAIAAQPFKAMDVKEQQAGRSELDQDSSRSSWYFCFNNYNWYSPTYYYYGYQYSYTPYYQYSWGGYYYSYYSWSYNWGGGWRW